MTTPPTRKITQRTIITSAVAAVLVLIIAFAYVIPQLTKPPTPPTQPAKPKVLVVGTTDELWGPDPYDMRGYPAHMLSSLIYDTPVTLEWTKDGWKLKPNLATRWETTDKKGQIWEFELRKDVFFHDGTPFNASCVKFSIDRVIEGKKGEYFTVGAYVKSVEVIDNYKIRVNFYDPFSGGPAIMVMSCTAITSPSAVKRWGDQYSTKSLAGTGPFKLDSWIPGDQIAIVKNDKYWNKERLPKIDKFIMKFFKDPSTLKLALEKKEIDVLHRTPLSSDIPALQANPGLTVFKGPEPLVREFSVNPRPQAPAGKYLSNVLVRQAIAYAIDYERIAKFRDAQRVYGVYHKDQSVPSVAIDPQKDFKYDPAKAKQLMTQAGYPNGFAETLEMICCPAYLGAEEVEMASIIKSNLEAIGIKSAIRTVDFVLFFSLMNTGNTTLAPFSVTTLNPDPDYFGGVCYHSQGVMAKRFGFNRTDVDQLVLQARAELNVTKRIELYYKIQMIADGPDLLRGQIYLYRPWNYAIAWKYVKGDLTPTLMYRHTIDWTQIDIDPDRKIS